jgi:transposase-like protein
MNTREIAAEYRLTKWASLLTERAEKKESIRDYCTRQGISKNTFYYWQRKVREAVIGRMSEPTSQTPSAASLPPAAFTEVRIAEPPESLSTEITPTPICTSSLIIEVGRVKMTADSAYPTDRLAALCRELAKPC